ncbi:MULTISPECIES: type I 3-dehydroquinate dehydratase [Halorussus]|uniref:type I 3-dehydroquinate dehydratase n=1 Tax=Halorussus TaxID=1070314 RepID=UPI00209EFB57|nr:type I 3-dehydroquinate dehydratase [Halorussus vallis]USZ74986.1 type I 3-dehydroquinate dehydratase [Halorussus vallis]
MNAGEYQLVGLTDDLSQVSTVEDIIDLVEFRFGEAKDPYGQISNYDGDTPIIVSDVVNQVNSSEEQEKALYNIVSEQPADKIKTVEFELSVAKENEHIVRKFQKESASTVISYYNVEETPTEQRLQNIISNCSQYGDIAKIVVRAETETDALSLLQCLNAASRQGIDVAGYALGDIGKHTRVISIFYGAQMAYAPIAGYEGSSDTEEIDLRLLQNLLKTLINSESATLIDELQGKF